MPNFKVYVLTSLLLVFALLTAGFIGKTAKADTPVFSLQNSQLWLPEVWLFDPNCGQYQAKLALDFSTQTFKILSLKPLPVTHFSPWPTNECPNLIDIEEPKP